MTPLRRPSAERRPPPFVVRGAPAPAAAGPEAPAYELPLILLGVVLLLAAPLAERTLAPSGSRDGSLARDFGLAAADPGDQRSALDVRGGASAQPEEPMVTPLEGRDSTALMLPRKRDAGGADRSAAVAGSSAEGPAGAGLADASAASGAGSTASSGPPGSSWKDAISAARSAAAQASSKASFPRANPRMQAGIQEALAKLPGLDKSLGAATSSASLPAQQLASPTSERLVGTPRVITSLTAPKTPGDFRGAASRGLASSGFGLLSPGVRGGSFFDHARGGENMSARAAGASAPEAPSGAALPAAVQAQNTEMILKGAANPNAGNKSISSAPIPENLAQLMAKTEMEQALKLKWDKKRYDELERKKMVQQIAVQTLFQTAQQASLKVLDKILNPNGQQQQQQ